MSVITKDRRGAIFVDTGGGHKKLAGYRVMIRGTPGIAYLKNDELAGFMPIAELINDFCKNELLILSGKELDRSIKGADQK